MSKTPRMDYVVTRNGLYDNDEEIVVGRQIESELAEAYGALSETIRLANEEMDGHKAELAAASEIIKEQNEQIAHLEHTRFSDRFECERMKALVKRFDMTFDWLRRHNLSDRERELMVELDEFISAAAKEEVCNCGYENIAANSGHVWRGLHDKSCPANTRKEEK